jgi:hypothetical protein
MIAKAVDAVDYLDDDDADRGVEADCVERGAELKGGGGATAGTNG